MINADTRELEKYTKNLVKSSKYALADTIRNTLNKMAYEVADIAKNSVLPRMFTLRNKFIQKSVGYTKVKTNNINQMVSYVGQRSRYLGRDTDQLAHQETGSSIVSKGKYTAVATKQSRVSRSFSRKISGRNYLNKLKIVNLGDIVNRKTNNPKLELAQAVGYAKKNKKTIIVSARTKYNYKGGGVFRVSPRGVKSLYSRKNKITRIKKKPWLDESTKEVARLVPGIYQGEAVKRLEKEMFRGLKR